MSLFDNLYKGTQTTEDGRVSGRGLGAFVLNPFVDEEKLNQDAQRTLNQQTAVRMGEDLNDLGVGPNASTYDVEGAAIRTQRDRTTKQGDKNYERSMEPMRAQLKSQNDQFQANHQLQLQQLAQSDKRYLMDRADAREQRAMELEYMKMRDRKEDMRYNERMEQLDRKDRRMAMQSLAAGLASLGAAFAM